MISNLCACGCGEEVSGTWKRGHQARRPERKLALAARNRTDEARLASARSVETRRSYEGERNPAWRGDDVGYTGIHLWIAEVLPRTGVCSSCGSEGYTEYHNISGEYKRSNGVEDWEELCKPCHLEAHDA